MSGKLHFVTFMEEEEECEKRKPLRSIDILIHKKENKNRVKKIALHDILGKY